MRRHLESERARLKSGGRIYGRASSTHDSERGGSKQKRPTAVRGGELAQILEIAVVEQRHADGDQQNLMNRPATPLIPEDITSWEPSLPSNATSLCLNHCALLAYSPAEC
jgi:hypothetical protein